MVALNPLPSLIRASSHDAAGHRMRAAGRRTWTRGDYNAAARTQTRLIRDCYFRPWDESGSPWPFIRFRAAEELQQLGAFHFDSDFAEINALIDLACPPPRELWPHTGEAWS